MLRVKMTGMTCNHCIRVVGVAGTSYPGQVNAAIADAGYPRERKIATASNENTQYGPRQ
jgi:hypothetical protein